MLFLGSVVKGKGRPVTLRDISHVPSGLKTSRAPFCRNRFSGISYLLLRPHLFRVPLRSSGLLSQPGRALPSLYSREAGPAAPPGDLSLVSRTEAKHPGRRELEALAERS